MTLTHHCCVTDSCIYNTRFKLGLQK